MYGGGTMRPIDRLIGSTETADGDGSEQVKQARQIFQGGDAAGAVAATQRLLREHPRCAAGHFLLGEIYASKNSLALALPNLEKAYELSPSHFDYLLRLAICLYDMRQYDRARPLLEKAHHIHHGDERVKRYLDAIGPAATSSDGPRPMAPTPTASLASGPVPEAYPSVAPVPPSASPAAPTPASRNPDDPDTHKGTDVFLALHEGEFKVTRRKADFDSIESDVEEEVDIRSPEFWQQYRRFNPTEHGVALSEAEKSGQVNIGSEDFHGRQLEEFQREVKEKEDRPILSPEGARIRAAICWTWGLSYVDVASGWMRIAAQGMLLTLVLLAAWGLTRVEVNESLLERLLGEGRLAAWSAEASGRGEDLVRNCKIQFVSFLLVSGGLAMALYGGLTLRCVRFCAREARRRNLDLAVVLEVLKDFRIVLNIGQSHGVTASNGIIVLKRQFHSVYDSSTGERQLKSRFTRAGWAGIVHLEERKSVAMYYPDRGQVVIPKVGDRVEIVDSVELARRSS